MVYCDIYCAFQLFLRERGQAIGREERRMGLGYKNAVDRVY